jgi:hypothetical protein
MSLEDLEGITKEIFQGKAGLNMGELIRLVGEKTSGQAMKSDIAAVAKKVLGISK